jgi:hypothetical protein
MKGSESTSILEAKVQCMIGNLVDTLSAGCGILVVN